LKTRLPQLGDRREKIGSKHLKSVTLILSYFTELREKCGDFVRALTSKRGQAGWGGGGVPGESFR
jgi:hypothetical protein